MPNTPAWDRVPVHAWYETAPGVPSRGTVEFKIVGAPNGVKRVDGRAIYRAGATIRVKIGAAEDQDTELRNKLRAAYKAQDQALALLEGGVFDEAAWDAEWDARLPAMICTSFYAQDDPDITPQGWQIHVRERLTSGEGDTGPYPLELRLVMKDATPIPGINLADIELPPGTPTVPAPVYAKGQPGGIAALDAEGYVLGADGTRLPSAEDLVAAVDGTVPATRKVNGKALSSDVSLGKGDLGLGNVDDTRDLDKPVSLPQAEAIAAAVSDKATTGQVSAVAASVSGKADKQRILIDVTDAPYSAAGNGTTDDTAAWQAAVDACPVGGTITGRGKTYLVSTVNFKSDMNVRDARFLTKPGSTDFVAPVTVGAYNDTALRQNIYFKNVHVDGQRTGQTSIGASEDGGRHGFRLIGAIRNLVMEDCTAVNCASDGLSLYRGSGMTSILSFSTGIKSKMRFVRCSFTGNRRHGVAIDTATDVKFTDCNFNGNGLNADGSITPGSSTSGAAGAIMPSVGGLYGNGVDVEEYDLKSYAGDITFEGCEGLGNAKSGLLAYSGPMLASDPNFVTRTGYHVRGGTYDAGISAASSGYAIDITSSLANKALGWYFDDVNVIDVKTIGLVNFRSVKTAKHRGGSAVIASGNYLGNADTVQKLRVGIPGRDTLRYFTGAVTSNRYDTDPEAIWVGAAQLSFIGGAPTLNAINFVPAVTLRDAQNDRLGVVVPLPSDWERGHVDLYWTNRGAAAGDVTLRCDSQVIAEGGAIVDSASGATAVTTAAGQNVLTVTRVATNRSTVSAGLVGLEILRLGTDAADTLAADIGIIGLKITRSI